MGVISERRRKNSSTSFEGIVARINNVLTSKGVYEKAILNFYEGMPLAANTFVNLVVGTVGLSSGVMRLVWKFHITTQLGLLWTLVLWFLL